MNYAIILAGGKGVRFGSGQLPKQFVKLEDMPMVIYSMLTAQKNANIHEMCVVAEASYHEDILQWAAQFNISKPICFAIPGKERHQSVFSGLCAIKAKDRDTVMIMTSVCPLLSQNTIDNHYKLIQQYDGVITVVKATDAITKSKDGKLAECTLQKSEMFVQQGPQTYYYGDIRKAHEKYNQDQNRREVFEDSELVLMMGKRIAMTLGDRFCIKVTYPEDLAIANALLPLFLEQEKSKKDEAN